MKEIREFISNIRGSKAQKALQNLKDIVKTKQDNRKSKLLK